MSNFCLGLNSANTWKIGKYLKNEASPQPIYICRVLSVSICLSMYPSINVYIYVYLYSYLSVLLVINHISKYFIDMGANIQIIFRNNRYLYNEYIYVCWTLLTNNATSLHWYNCLCHCYRRLVLFQSSLTLKIYRVTPLWLITLDNNFLLFDCV